MVMSDRFGISNSQKMIRALPIRDRVQKSGQYVCYFCHRCESSVRLSAGVMQQVMTVSAAKENMCRAQACTRKLMWI